MACGGFICSRNTLILLNVLYFFVGTILIGLAAYAKVLALITTIPVMSGIIACGVFLAIIAIAGLVGAVKHHQVLLFFYMVILFLIFLLQISVACASLALTDGQQKEFFKWGWGSASIELRSTTQNRWSCCGMDKDHQINNESDSRYNHPNCSHCNSSLPCCTGVMVNSSSSWAKEECPIDCWSILEPELHQVIRGVGAVGLFFSFTEIVGIWLTFRYRNQKDPRANPSAFL